MSEPDITLTKKTYDAVIFDLDGVITRTAKVHFKAWKKMFDEFLEKRAGEDFKPFDEQDYREFVDGKPRLEGVKSFLHSRGITLSQGAEHDGPEKETVHGLGSRKNSYFLELINKDGVEVFEPALRLLQELRNKTFKTAVVSSSRNCALILDAAGLSGHFDTKADGEDVQELGLEGKPSPDIFLMAAQRLKVNPERAVVLEDAVSGVQAGEKGGFGLVIGVDRTGHAARLKESGAHVVISDLSKVKVRAASFEHDPVPSALENFDQFTERLKNKRIAICLDYDGTLTPIVDDPQKAVLSEEMRRTLLSLADSFPVAVISGRDLQDVQNLVGIDSIFYAGSHGFDISGPGISHAGPEEGKKFLPALDRAEKEISRKMENISGAWVEKKKFSIAVHYRKVDPGETELVEQAVREVAGAHPELRQSGGKKIFELQPRMDWHKGKALMWILDRLGLDQPDVIPVFIGDDVTDEDAFKTLKDRGIGVAVMDPPRETEASCRLKDPEEVRFFLNKLIFTEKGKN